MADNSNVGMKVALRDRALANVGDARVLDCYAGEGVMYRRAWNRAFLHASVTALEEVGATYYVKVDLAKADPAFVARTDLRGIKRSADFDVEEVDFFDAEPGAAVCPAKQASLF